MRKIFLAAIVCYQRYLSPYKGFCCAYRAHTGQQSCSALGFRAIRRYGVFAGLTILRRRLFLCGVVHRRHSVFHPPRFQSQRGFCDVGCDLPCDFSGADGCISIGDIFSCCDIGSCDWPSRKQKRDNQDQYIYIRPSGGIKKNTYL